MAQKDRSKQTVLVEQSIRQTNGHCLGTSILLTASSEAGGRKSVTGEVSLDFASLHPWAAEAAGLGNTGQMWEVNSETKGGV
jgi:hypothetical protein